MKNIILPEPNPSLDHPFEPSSHNLPIAHLEIDAGPSLPPSRMAHLPVLNQLDQQGQASDATFLNQALTGGALQVVQGTCVLAQGIEFEGNAILAGPCSIAGKFTGNLYAKENTQVAVVISETGEILGDITASKISVMGRAEGMLDAGMGEVSLHDSATVHGLVRYGRIQVNGADLNATLERVSPKTGGR